MMTSNFTRNDIEKFPNAVSIARSFLRFKRRRYSQIAPSRDLFTECLTGYAIEYPRETLDKLDPMKVFEDLGYDAVLLKSDVETEQI